MSQRTRALLVAIILVLLAGVGLAAVQPGDIGDDDGDTEAVAGNTTTTTADGGGPSTTAAQVTTTTTEREGETTPTTDAGSEGSATTTTQAPSSGLGTNGSGSAGEQALADTGGLPLVVPGILLLAAGLLSRRLLLR